MMRNSSYKKNDRVGGLFGCLPKSAPSCSVLLLSLALCAMTLSGCSGTTGPDGSETESQTSNKTPDPSSPEESSEPEESISPVRERRFGRGEMWHRDYDAEAFRQMYSAEIPEEVIPDKTVTIRIAVPGEGADTKIDTNTDRGTDSSSGGFEALVKERFHAEIEWVMDPEEADLIFYEPTAPELYEAAKNGKLTDLESSGLLDTYGAYLKTADAAMLSQVRSLVACDGLFGVGTMVGYKNESFSCEQNLPVIRFDVYQQIGSPELRTLEDLPPVLKQMVEACPKNDEGGKTYAVTYSREWDGDLPFFLKTTANLYGYDDWGIGFYNVAEQRFEPLLEEDGIGLRLLRFYNRLYRTGLIDPDSDSQTADEAREKLAKGTAMWNPDPTDYNTETHLSEGKAMLMLPAEDFVICDLALAPWMPEGILAIAADTEQPEFCMAFLNWLATPEGCMSVRYGKRGTDWDQDENGAPYLIDRSSDGSEGTEDPKEAGQGSNYSVYLSLWAEDALNPENGFTYRAADWPSEVPGSRSSVEEDWSAFTGYASARDLLTFEEQIVLTPYTGSTVLPAVPEELNPAWRDSVDVIRKEIDDIIHANSDEVFDINVRLLRKHLQKAGYEDCLKFAAEAAAVRKSSEDALERMTVPPEAEDASP